MQTAPPLLALLLVLLSNSGWANGLCNLVNGTVAKCHELDDVKYIETYDLESLKASVADQVLSPGLFKNLSALEHLDLSGGDLERVEPGSFQKLVNLRSLDLADNRIGYLELASLDGLNHLRSLNLRKNNLRLLPPALARLKILRHLDVQGNPLQCNCATLRVRDLIVKRGVKMSKKILCAGPNNMKGTPLLTPDATIICNLEEQDREMQKDQALEGSGDELISDEILDDLNEEEAEYVEVHDTSSEAPSEPEIETPYPGVPGVSTDASVATSSLEVSSEPTTAAEDTVSSPMASTVPHTSTEEDEIFFDSDDKKERTSVAPQTTREYEFKDALFYPVEGSGDEEEGSGEGSGAGMIFTDWSKPHEVTSAKDGEESTSSEDSLFNLLFNVLWSTTAAPEEKSELDLEDEQFIDASSTKETQEDVILPKKVPVNEVVPSTVEVTTRVNLFSPTSGVELVDPDAVLDTSKSGNVKLEEEGVIDELAEVSPARQSKKGMGSYVVLAALLAVLGALIGFAAYKGDFCRKRRKRSDVENGTEMKDMQKALLDTGNSTQPKIASNGNAESVPLVEATPDNDEPKSSNGQQTDGPRSQNGTSDYTDPVKPPRRAVSSHDDEKSPQETSSLKDDSLSARTSSIDPTSSSVAANNGPACQLSEENGPPLSPGAQRVKITLQENPDSVPRTPILITRTMAGENLVKTP